MNKTAGKEYSLSRESPRQCESNIYAKENRQCISTPAVFHGHRWITQAALLKTAHWAVFALSSATAPQLFESPRNCESDAYTKENR